MPQPITSDWKISRVLAEYPQLLNTIVSLSPAFERLRNPLMRKVQSRLVTVAQAARIARVDETHMLATLNAAIGVEAAPVQESIAAPAPDVNDELPDVPVHTTIDVREVIARGEQPFTPVMRAARQVPVGQVLRLIVSFEPVPLYDALAEIGYRHDTYRQGDTWHVFATRETDRQAVQTVLAPQIETAAETATAEVTIDISELVPPEPMMKVLAALHELPDGGVLTVHHVRRPVHLYDRLDALGYPHETTDIVPDQVRIVIRKGHQPS